LKGAIALYVAAVDVYLKGGHVLLKDGTGEREIIPCISSNAARATANGSSAGADNFD
jgi:hypothetical protein